MHGESNEQIARGSWDPFEPRTIATGCLAMAYVFVFLQILNLMRTNRTFGPLQLSLAKMLINVIQFLCIFSLILFAFALSLTELYSYYGTTEGSLKLCKFLQNGTKADCNTNFRNMGDSIYGLFWSLFGFLDVNDLSLNGKQPFLETVGFILIGTYHVAAITILINMLIAMMAKSFDATSENKEAEWKFYRTVVWIQFIRRDTTIPPPMNLIPNPWKIAKFIRKCIFKLRNQGFSMKTSCLFGSIPCSKEVTMMATSSHTGAYELNVFTSRSSNQATSVLEDEVDDIPDHVIRQAKKKEQKMNGKSENEIDIRRSSKTSSLAEENVVSSQTNKSLSDSVSIIIEPNPSDGPTKLPTPEESHSKVNEVLSSTTVWQGISKSYPLDQHHFSPQPATSSQLSKTCAPRLATSQDVKSKLVQRYISMELRKGSLY